LIIFTIFSIFDETLPFVRKKVVVNVLIQLQCILGTGYTVL